MNLKKLVFLLLFFESLTLAQNGSTQTAPTKAENTHWITVFVHGIMSVQPHVSISNIARFLQDKIDDTAYSATIKTMRSNPFFHKNQAMQQLGLRSIDTLNITPGNTSGALSILLTEMEKAAGIPDITNHYYTFGWGGLLSYSSRYRDAIHFFNELEKLVADFKTKGITPKIRIIGYSHGGNVCLSLALARQEHFAQSALKIDELVLVATPIQRETDFLINDPLFTRIYNLFSRKDRIQELDFFNKNRYFSHRLFKQRKGFTLPKKLLQIDLKVTRVQKGILSDSNRFIHSGTFDKPSIINGTSKLLRDMSPGHIEFWFFAWTPRFYRSTTFPLRPFPAIVMLPFIRKQIELNDDLASPKSLIADYRPEHGVILFKQREKCNTSLLRIAPFIDKELFAQLAHTIHGIDPQDFSPTNYRNHVMHASQQGGETHHKKRHSQEHRHHNHEAKREKHNH